MASKRSIHNEMILGFVISKRWYELRGSGISQRLPASKYIAIACRCTNTSKRGLTQHKARRRSRVAATGVTAQTEDKTAGDTVRQIFALNCRRRMRPTPVRRTGRQRAVL